MAAISGAFGAAGGNPKVQAELAAAFSSTVGKLSKRNATVELLRYLAFSNCQAYANNGISAANYAGGLEQISDLSITLLAIEQVTSPNAGEGTLIISPGKSGASISINPNGVPGKTPTSEDPATATPDEPPTGTPPDDTTPSDGTNETAPSKDVDEGLAGGDAAKPSGAEGNRPEKSILVTAGEGGSVSVGTVQQGQGVSPLLAKEVREMLKLALTKRVKDSCLSGLRELSLIKTSELAISSEVKTAQAVYIAACSELLASNSILTNAALLKIQGLNPQLDEMLKEHVQDDKF